MTLWEQWRPWIRQQRSLLRELILMLLAMLVVGVYFLEHFSAGLEQERKVQLQALAQQTARRAAEALASEDSISINLHCFSFPNTLRIIHIVANSAYLALILRFLN